MMSQFLGCDESHSLFLVVSISEIVDRSAWIPTTMPAAGFLNDAAKFNAMHFLDWREWKGGTKKNPLRERHGTPSPSISTSKQA